MTDNFSETSRAVIPAFLAKLWKLVNDPQTDNLICWSNSGQSFIIGDTIRFTKDLLPVYFKHNNLSSFIRQLNMYGFHKVISVESGGLKKEKNSMEFSHTCFFRDHPYLMENIKRKPPTRTNGAPHINLKEMKESQKDLTQPEILAQVLADVNNLKQKQAGWDHKLASMKRENEALWRELAIFRQKHHKQEQMINRLIQFIITMVRPSPSRQHASIRRRIPLMLDNSDDVIDMELPLSSQSSGMHGPAIRELDSVQELLNRSRRLSPRNQRQPWDTSSSECVITNLDDNYASPELDTTNDLGEQDTIYDVISPRDNSPETAASPWLYLEGSDLEDAAMTPINPHDVTPDTHKNNILQSDVQRSPVKSNNEAAVVKNRLNATIPKYISVPQKKVTVRRSSAENVMKPPPQAAALKHNYKGIKDGNKLDQLSLLSAFKNPYTVENATKPKTNQPPYSTLRNQSMESNVTGKKRRKSVQPKKRKRKDVSALQTPEKNIVSGTCQPAGECIDAAIPLEPNNDAFNGVLEIPDYLDPAYGTEVQNKNIVVADEGDLLLDPETLTVAKPSTSTGYYANDLANDLGNHVEQVQGDIDILKELLKNDSYNLDASTLLELFNDDPMNLIMPPASENKGTTGECEGNELMTYSTPNLVDLADLYVASPSRGVRSQEPPLTSSSGLDTPIITPASPAFPAKRRRK